MSSADRVEAYATALFAVAKAEGSLAQVESELFSVARTFESNDELRSKLTDQAIPVAVRQGIVEALLGDRASDTTTSLVSFIIGAGRGRDLPKIIDLLVEEAATERDEAVATVRTAVPIDDATQQRLATALSAATGQRVSVKVNVDPTVLGGVIAQIGDTVIDGSVRRRLDQLKESL